ncbi:DNA methyltransferase [Candidatus Pacearchaeota archaeon CG10_big_fil_rev_8_21_14_0_10_30_48]|nr:MAG: DNA methyltransferase [Candidatus Pacearchaeota archaeon CG10_big_fil_rev_8_21_14_0_10_30_48]
MIENKMVGIILNKDRFLEVVSDTERIEDSKEFKEKIKQIKDSLETKNDSLYLLNIVGNGDTINYKKEILISNLQQIIESQTLERAKYYLERLKKGIEEVKTSKINDINLNRWKEYEDLTTDSLWYWKSRDSSGVHIASYWGNFIPQIPNQTLRRYTKKGDWVLDTFSGSGTTMIECKRLGRNGIGIELNPRVVKDSKELISKEENPFKVFTDVIEGDSRFISHENLLKNNPNKKFQMVIMHPPYHDIIKFSQNKEDLSNAKNLKEFLEMFGKIVENVTPFLENNRYLVLVIGDKYSKGEWIPLGHLTMLEVLKKGYTLKSTIVKNIENTLGKRNQEDLWRYRALVGGFYIFKHEYIFIFKKTGNKDRLIDEVVNLKEQ